jgi:site-specific recombinase XerD
MAEPEINAFVTHLAVEEKVSASTQTQALSAILFLYRHVLHREVGELAGLVRARKPARLPVVLSREEVCALLEQLRRTDEQSWLSRRCCTGPACASTSACACACSTSTRLAAS